MHAQCWLVIRERYKSMSPLSPQGCQQRVSLGIKSAVIHYQGKFPPNLSDCLMACRKRISIFPEDSG